MKNNDLHDHEPSRPDDLPEHDPLLEPIVHQVVTWAGTEQNLPSIDLAQLSALTDPAPKRIFARFSLPRAAWVLATASLLVYCLSLLNVRLEWGAAILELGRDINREQQDSAVADLGLLETRFNMQHATLENQLSKLAKQYVALESEFRETTASLAQAQDTESATRYNDICRILKLTYSK